MSSFVFRYITKGTQSPVYASDISRSWECRRSFQPIYLHRLLSKWLTFILRSDRFYERQIPAPAQKQGYPTPHSHRRPHVLHQIHQSIVKLSYLHCLAGKRKQDTLLASPHVIHVSAAWVSGSSEQGYHLQGKRKKLRWLDSTSSASIAITVHG